MKTEKLRINADEIEYFQKYCKDTSTINIISTNKMTILGIDRYDIVVSYTFPFDLYYLGTYVGNHRAFDGAKEILINKLNQT